MENLIIFGTSRIADIVYTYLNNSKKYNIVAFTVDEQYINESSKFDKKIVPFEMIEDLYPPHNHKMIVAIGYHDLNRIREEKCKQASEKGYDLISFIDEEASIACNVSIGKNCIILDNVTIEPFANIGNNVCIYSGAVIAHHSTVKDNAWVTSGTVVGGNSIIGKNCFLGINATIGHNIEIGDNNFIGAGAIVTKTTEADSVYICPDTPKYRLSTNMFLKMFKFD